MGTYRLRVPASRVGYVPEAQGGLPPGPHVQYVLGTRTSLGRTVSTAHRGTQASPASVREMMAWGEEHADQLAAAGGLQVLREEHGAPKGDG